MSLLYIYIIYTLNTTAHDMQFSQYIALLLNILWTFTTFTRHIHQHIQMLQIKYMAFLSHLSMEII